MKFRLMALACAAAAAPAFATTTASMSVGPVQTALVDLTPGDGVAPSFAWLATRSVSAGATDYMQSGWTVTPGYPSYEPNWGSGTNGGQYLSDPAVTTVSSTSPFGFGQSAASADATGPISISAQASVEAGARSFIYANVLQTFVLGAGSKVTFSTLVDSRVSGPEFTGVWTPPVTPSSWAPFSTSSFNVALSVNNVNAQIMGGGSTYWWPGDAYESSNDGQQLKLTIQNTSSVAKEYSLLVTGYLSLHEAVSISAVPEPGSYALMALGLVGVGAVARRRKA